MQRDPEPEASDAEPAAAGGGAGATAPGEGTGGIGQRGGITLVGAVLGGVLVLANEIFAARFLGVETYGLYALGMTFARTGEVIALFGLHIAVLHFVPIHRSDGRLDRVGGTILGAAILPLAGSALLVAGVWVLAPAFAEGVLGEPAATPFLRAFVLAIPLLASCEISGAVSRGFGRALPYVLVRNLIPPGVYAVGIAALAWSGADGLWIAAAFAGAHGVALGVGALAVARVTGPKVWRHRPRPAFRTLSRYSAPIFVNTLLFAVLATTDIVMLGGLQGPEEVGVYRGCLQLVAFFPMVIIAFTAAVSHILPVQVKQGRRAELDRTYGTVTRWTSSIAMAGVVLIALNRVDLLSLLGERFEAGSVALGVLLGSMLIRSFAGTGAVLLVLSGRQRLETFNSAVGVGLNVLLNLWLIPRYSIVGAAAATLGAHLAMNALRVIQIRRSLGIEPLRTRMLGLLAAGTATLALASAVAHGLGLEDGGGLAGLAVRLPATALLLVPVLWRVALTEEDRELIRGAWERRRGAAEARS